MKRIEHDKSPKLWDEFSFLGPKRRRLLDEGWSGVFRRFVCDSLPVEEMAAAFHDTRGRPTKEIRVMAGTLILQQMFDLPDEEALERLSFDIRWHYALDTEGEADDLKYVCEKTLRNYRSLVVQKNLDEVMFRNVTDRLLKAFCVPTEKQRLDSTHICSNMRNLTRIEIMEEVIKKFLRNLKRSHHELYKACVSEEVKERYRESDGREVFGGGRPGEGKKKLEILAKDLFWLVERFKGTDATKMYSYGQMSRVFSEQCEITGKAEEQKVVVREAKEVPSDCLQNPADEDSAYDKHKGVGYQAQLQETYQETSEDEDEKDRPPNLITHVRVEPANRSDAGAVDPAIEDTEARGCKPKTLTADTAYGSDKNVTEAAGEGVELVTPPPATNTGAHKMTRDKFELTETECICPQGQHSRKLNKNKEKVTAEFDGETCLACPCRNRCVVTVTKQRAYVRFDHKQARLAKRRTESKTDEFKDKYRWRAGVEGTMSEAKRTTGLGRLRVRGLPRVRFCTMLKLLGVNIRRCARSMRLTHAPQTGLAQAKIGALSLLYASITLFRLFRPLSKPDQTNQPQQKLNPEKLWAMAA